MRKEKSGCEWKIFLEAEVMVPGVRVCFGDPLDWSMQTGREEVLEDERGLEIEFEGFELIRWFFYVTGEPQMDCKRAGV